MCYVQVKYDQDGDPVIAEERDRGGGLSRLCVLKDGEQVDIRDPEGLANVSVFEEVGQDLLPTRVHLFY